MTLTVHSQQQGSIVAFSDCLWPLEHRLELDAEGYPQAGVLFGVRFSVKASVITIFFQDNSCLRECPMCEVTFWPV